MGDIRKAFKIRKHGDSEWTVLPVPLDIQPEVNALDAETSGRDNSIGDMFRDITTVKQKYVFTIPEGLNETEGAKIFNIIIDKNNASFDVYVPDPMTAHFNSRTFYSATLKPKFKKIISESSWIYDEMSFTATEM